MEFSNQKRGGYLMKKNQFMCLITALFLTVLFLSTACAGNETASSGNTPSADSSNADSNSFILGFVSPLSGVNADAGTQALNAAQIAVKQVNARGGLNGEQIRLISYDDEANPATSLAAITKLATTDNANAVIGSIMSGCMMSSLDTIEQYKLPTFSSGLSGSLSQQGCHYYWRTHINQDYVAKDIIEAFQMTGVKTVAVFSNQDEAQINASDAFVEACEEIGVEVVAREYGPDTDTDYTAQCARLIASNPDVMYFALTTPAHPIFVKQVRELGYKGMLWNRESFAQNGIDIAGIEASNYVAFSWPTITYTDVNEAEEGLMKDFLIAYQDEYGELPTNDCAYRGYNAVLLIEEACRIAGSNEREAIAAAAHTIKNFEILGGITDYTNGTGEGLSGGRLYYVNPSFAVNDVRGLRIP
jgi:branched-chain amino acid transport system substrate-binding protein